MGDMGDDFRAWNKVKQEKKRSNLETSTQLLIDNNISFKSHNYGVHIAVVGNNEIIDFWPSTGKWIVRKTNIKGRGIFKLLRRIKNEKL